MGSKLTQELKFRHGAIIRNRIAMAPMQTHSGAKDGYVTEDTIQYYESRSEAAGLLITEFHYVSKNGGPSYIPGYPEQLSIDSDEHIEGVKRIAKALKKNGNKAILQIHHAGRKANGLNIVGEEVVAPSSLNREYPVRSLTENEITEIIDDFGEATRRAIEAGFDGVELHGANHYLIQQFFSTFTNQRNDQWGGNLEKRMAFPLAVVRKVKEIVKEYGPEEFIVGYRISPDEIHGETTGYTHEDSMKLVSEIIKYEIDYIHLSLQNGYSGKPLNTDKSYAELFREILDDETKLIVVGGVFSQEDAEDAVSNYSDIIAVGRGTLVEPLFAKKIEDGIGNEIVHEISSTSLEYSNLTPGLIEVFSKEDAFGLPLLPNGNSILKYHTGKFD